MARGLLPIWRELEGRQHEPLPAVGRSHLACDLRVPRLVGVPEWVATEVLEEETAGDEREQAGTSERGARRHRLWTHRAGALYNPPMRARAPALVLLGLVVGSALGYAAGRVLCVRHTATLAGRVAMLEAQAGQVQTERDRLHQELADLLRERREMADTAEHLRTQIEQQLRRLEALEGALAPPPEAGSP